MTISSQERDANKVKVLVDYDVVDTTFEKWAKQWLKEKKGRSARLSPATKFGHAVWVVEGAGGAYQPIIWPYSHPALRRPKAPLFATSAKRSPNALRARGQVERQWGQGPSHRGPRPAPAPRSRPRKVLTQEDRSGVSRSVINRGSSSKR